MATNPQQEVEGWDRERGNEMGGRLILPQVVETISKHPNEEFTLDSLRMWNPELKKNSDKSLASVLNRGIDRLPHLERLTVGVWIYKGESEKLPTPEPEKLPTPESPKNISKPSNSGWEMIIRHLTDLDDGKMLVQDEETKRVFRMEEI